MPTFPHVFGSLPGGSYPASDLDDNFNAVGQLYQAASVGGTANGITITITYFPGAYAKGQSISFIPASTNTGDTYVDVNGIGNVQLLNGGSPCVGGECVTGVPMLLQYDGTDFNIVAQTAIKPSIVGSVVRTLFSKATEWKSVKDCGAECDGIYLNSSSVTVSSGSNAFTITGGGFVSLDIGKVIAIPGAGTSGAPLITKISGVSGLTTITTADNASTALAGVATLVTYGTDDTSAINTALGAGVDLLFPGVSIVTGALSQTTAYQQLFGDGLLSGIAFCPSSSIVGLTLLNSSGRQCLKDIFIYGIANCSKLISGKSPQVTCDHVRLKNDTSGGHVYYNEDENTGSGIYTFGLKILNHSYLTGSYVSGAYGVRLGVNSQTSSIRDSTVENCGTLVKCEGATDALGITGNTLENSVDYAIDLSQASATPTMLAILISGNHFEQNQVCIHTAGGQYNNCKAVGNYCYRNTASITGSRFYKADIGASAASTGWVFDDNNISDFEYVFELNDEYGSRILSAKNIQYSGGTGYSTGTYASNAYNVIAVNPASGYVVDTGTIAASPWYLSVQGSAYVPIQLPSHAVIQGISFYANNAGANVEVDLIKIPLSGTTPTIIATVTTTGTGTFSLAGTGGYTLDGYMAEDGNSYALHLSNGGGAVCEVYPIQFSMYG